MVVPASTVSAEAPFSVFAKLTAEPPKVVSGSQPPGGGRVASAIDVSTSVNGRAASRSHQRGNACDRTMRQPQAKHTAGSKNAAKPRV